MTSVPGPRVVRQLDTKYTLVAYRPTPGKRRVCDSEYVDETPITNPGAVSSGPRLAAVLIANGSRRGVARPQARCSCELDGRHDPLPDAAAGRWMSLKRASRSDHPRTSHGEMGYRTAACSTRPCNEGVLALRGVAFTISWAGYLDNLATARTTSTTPSFQAGAGRDWRPNDEITASPVLTINAWPRRQGWA